jgi:type II secretory pathway pseudopilin PulG
LGNLVIGKLKTSRRTFFNFPITQLPNYSIVFDMPSPSHVTRKTARHREQGYILLTLLLIIALGIIFTAAIVPSITFNIKRDREEEMIHRGVQYSRAIRNYYKKFGRYPTKLEDLESTNNLRFLRKRYKDPMNCKNSQCQDFKLLHFGEVQLSLSGMGGGIIPGANPMGAAGGLNGSTGLGGLSQGSSFGGSSSFGSNSGSSFGQNQQTTNNSSDSSQPGAQGASDGSGTNPQGTGSDNSGSNQIGSGQIIGAPIVGVASATKDKDPTIREFNHKNKYKDWMFVYDPAMDRGGIITTPYQPQLAGFAQPGTPNLNGQSGSGTNGGSSFGSGNGFGSSPSGMQNSPNTPTTGGFGSSNPTSNPPPPSQ